MDKLIFLHAVTYLLKLQTDDVILDGHFQACPPMILFLLIILYYFLAFVLPLLLWHTTEACSLHC